MCVLGVKFCLIGEIPKRPTGADCKSAGECLRRFESCSPHLQTDKDRWLRELIEGKAGLFGLYTAGVAQLVEH
jgi:hypothetical protein